MLGMLVSPGPASQLTLHSPDALFLQHNSSGLRQRYVPRQASAVNLSTRVANAAEVARMRAELETLRAENRRLAAGGVINGKVGTD
jgi:hypothetical protein